MTAAPRPGWYPDPAGTQLFRWWDGEDWADVTSDTAHSAPPLDDPTADLRRQRAGPLRTLLILALGLTLVVGMSAAFGSMLWRDPAPSSVAPEGTAVHPGSVGQLDERTRTARIGPASMVLPDEPYRLDPVPRRLPGVVDLMFSADAVVHPPRESSQRWTSVVLFGHVAASTGRADLVEQAHYLMGRLSDGVVPKHRTRVADETSNDYSVDGRPGLMLTANLHYAIEGVPSTHDSLTVVVVRLDDGSYIVAASAVPNDSPAAVASQAAEALGTLRID